MTKSDGTAEPERTPDVDFSGGVRGKYAERYDDGATLVAISPDVAAYFPDSEAVNEALRTLVRVSGRNIRIPARKRPRD